MSAGTSILRFAGSVALVLTSVLVAAGHAYSQQPEPAKTAPAAATKKKAPVPAATTESQKQAQAILMRMAEFLSVAQRLSVSVRGGYDAVQTSGQRIEFGETRKVTLSRPDRLRRARPNALTTPAVTVEPNPSGLPTAIAICPTRSSSDGASSNWPAGRWWTCSSARSVSGSSPTG